MQVLVAIGVTCTLASVRAETHCDDQTTRHLSISSPSEYSDDWESIGKVSQAANDDDKATVTIPLDDRRSDLVKADFFVESTDGVRRPLTSEVTHYIDPVDGSSIGLILVKLGHTEIGDRFGFHVILRQHPQIAGPFLLWKFPASNCADATLNIDSPADYPVFFDMKNMVGGSEGVRDGREYWHWSKSVVPGLPQEVPEAWLAISHFQNPAALADALDQLYESRISDSQEIRKIVSDVTEGVHGPREQAAALYFWVSDHMHYQILPDNANSIVPRLPEQTLETKSGDCKDLTELLISLLRAKSIEAVAVFTQPADPTSTIARVGVNQYRHVLLYLPQLNLYIDPTLRDGGLDKPPAVLTSVVLRPNPVGLTRFPSDYPDSNLKSASVIRVSSDGSVTGSTKVNYSGPRSEYWTSYLNTLPAHKRETYIQSLLKRRGYMGTGTFEVHPAFESVYRSEISATYSGHVDLGGDRLQVPSDISFHGMAAVIEDFSRPKPIGDWQCEKGSIEEVYLISSPHGVRLPDPVNISNHFGTYTAVYAATGDEVRIDRKLVTPLLKTICNQEEFEQAREIATAIRRDVESPLFLKAEADRM